MKSLGDSWYELHTLIRIYLRDKLEESTFKDRAKKLYCIVMMFLAKQIKQTLTLEDIAKIKPFIDHLKIAAEELNQWLDNQDLISLFHGLSAFYQAQGLYQQAVPYYEQCLTLSKQRLDKNHPDFARSLNNLAALYEDQGKYAEAEPLYLGALAITEKQLGAEHPDVATNLNNLAKLYGSQGKYTEAEPLYQRAIAILLATLSENHPNTQTVKNNYNLMLSQLPDEELSQRFPPETVEMLRNLRQN